MKKVVIDDLITKVPKKFSPLRVAKVENCSVSLALIDGAYPFHRHNGDEFFLVYKGKVKVDFRDEESVTLKEGEGLLVKEGTVHRSSSAGKSYALVFEAVDLAYMLEEKEESQEG
ncbi:MAG: cupin domain-containing protein [Candidatus Aminicenantales bacterium]